MAKKFWKCRVCSDIHYGDAGPEICPTCETKDAFFEVKREVAMEAMDV